MNFLRHFLYLIQEFTSQLRVVLSIFIVVSIIFTLSLYLIPIQLFFNSGTEIIFIITIIFFAIGLIVLSILVAYQINKIIIQHNKNNAGSELHWRIAILFGGISILPSIFLATFGYFIVDYSFKGWFSERISTAVNESVKVAEDYLSEHTRSVRGSILEMVNAAKEDGVSAVDINFYVNHAIDNNLQLLYVAPKSVQSGVPDLDEVGGFTFAKNESGAFKAAINPYTRRGSSDPANFAMEVFPANAFKESSVSEELTKFYDDPRVQDIFRSFNDGVGPKNENEKQVFIDKLVKELKIDRTIAEKIAGKAKS